MPDFPFNELYTLPFRAMLPIVIGSVTDRPQLAADPRVAGWIAAYARELSAWAKHGLPDTIVLDMEDDVGRKEFEQALDDLVETPAQMAARQRIEKLEEHVRAVDSANLRLTARFNLLMQNIVNLDEDDTRLDDGWTSPK